VEELLQNDHFSATITGERQGTVAGQIHEKLTKTFFCCVISFISCNRYM